MLHFCLQIEAVGIFLIKRKGGGKERKVLAHSFNLLRQREKFGSFEVFASNPQKCNKYLWGQLYNKITANSLFHNSTRGNLSSTTINLYSLLEFEDAGRELSRHTVLSQGVGTIQYAPGNCSRSPQANYFWVCTGSTPSAIM